MFSIYGESGRIFRGAMEDLWHIEALRSVARARRTAAGHEPFPVSAIAGQPATLPAHTAAGVALSAYARAGATQSERHPLTRVADVMSHEVITVERDAPLLEAWRRLGRSGVGQAPVTDAHGRLVGLLTRSELLDLDRLPQPEDGPQIWRAFLMRPVSALMLTPVPAVAPETELRRVARVLLDTQLPGLPVVSEEGALAGFISRSDILRAVVHDPPLDLWS